MIGKPVLDWTCRPYLMQFALYSLEFLRSDEPVSVWVDVHLCLTFRRVPFTVHVGNLQRLGSQEREKSVKRAPCLASGCGLQEGQQLRSSTNTLRRWNPTPASDTRCIAPRYLNFPACISFTYLVVMQLVAAQEIAITRLDKLNRLQFGQWLCTSSRN